METRVNRTMAYRAETRDEIGHGSSSRITIVSAISRTEPPDQHDNSEIHPANNYHA
jgi:hypothetical protein